jgi:arsenate reductase (glutaredoxin)
MAAISFFSSVWHWLNGNRKCFTGRFLGLFMTILYGIPNCDTVKKARAWLDANGVAYEFHDFKKQGVPEHLLSGWLADVGWETLLNSKGSTWRKLDAAVQAGVVDAASAKALMMANASVIKRPVVQWRSAVLTVGFDTVAWAALATDNQ